MGHWNISRYNDRIATLCLPKWASGNEARRKHMSMHDQLHCAADGAYVGDGPVGEGGGAIEIKYEGETPDRGTKERRKFEEHVADITKRDQVR